MEKLEIFEIQNFGKEIAVAAVSNLLNALSKS